MTHADGKRWILVGLGARDELDAEGRGSRRPPRTAARASSGAQIVCWELPHKAREHRRRGRSSRARCWRPIASPRSSRRDDDGAAGIAELIVSDHVDQAAEVARAAIVAEAVNAARDLQNTPANDMTPTALGARAQAIAADARDAERARSSAATEIVGARRWARSPRSPPAPTRSPR